MNATIEVNRRWTDAQETEIEPKTETGLEYVLGFFNVLPGDYVYDDKDDAATHYYEDEYDEEYDGRGEPIKKLRPTAKLPSLLKKRNLSPPGGTAARKSTIHFHSFSVVILSYLATIKDEFS